MSGRWPEPVRPPLPVGLLTQADLIEHIDLAGRFLRDPEDPAFNPAEFGLVCAARTALIECLDGLREVEISRELAQEEPEDDRMADFRRWADIGRMETVQKVARKVIDELRQWLPEPGPYG